VWVQIAAIAADLTCWLQLLALHDVPDLARAEPKMLRFRMLHVPAQLSRGGRRRRLRLPAGWFDICEKDLGCRKPGRAGPTELVAY